MYKFLFLFIYIFFFMRLYSQKNFPVINTIEELDKYLAQEKKINNFHRIYFSTNFLWDKIGYNFEIVLGKKFTFNIATGLKTNIDIITQQKLAYQCSSPNYYNNNSYQDDCLTRDIDYFIEPEIKYIFKKFKRNKNDNISSYQLNIDGWYTSVQAFIINGNVNSSKNIAWGGHIFNNWGFQFQSKKVFGSIFAGYILYTLKDLPNTTVFNVMNFGINIGYILR